MSAVTRVYTSVRGLRTTIKDVGRLREIVQILVRHGFGALVTQLGLHETAGVSRIMEYTDEHEVPYTRAQRVRMSIEDLGPTFVKLGQILSTRPDLIPQDIIDELQHLQDAVPVLPWTDVRGVLEEELDQPVDEVFSEFDEAPIASASIAQVHRAVLADGRGEVVVKVQRPSISARIDSDLNILHLVARQAAAMVPELALMDPVGIAHEFEKALRRELDFGHERANIGRFALNFADFDGLRVPRVYDDVSSARLLTMEFIRGVKVTQAPAALGIDPYDVAPRMLRALFKMVFRDGYFHGDLHPGNILIEKDATIVLIDFGLVGRLTEVQRDHILDILIGMSRQDYRLVSRVFFDLGIKVRGVTYDYDAFEADVVELMETHVADKTLSEIDVGSFFGGLVSGAIRHNIRMPPTYTMVFKALMTIEGIGKTLAPEMNFIAEAQPFVKEMLVERYSPRRIAKESVDVLGALSRFLRVFPQAATQLLQDAQKGSLTLRVQSDDAVAIATELRESSQRQARAIVTAGALIAAALLEPPAVGGGVRWALIGLVALAVVSGFPLVVSMIRGR